MVLTPWFLSVLPDVNGESGDESLDGSYKTDGNGIIILLHFL